MIDTGCNDSATPTPITKFLTWYGQAQTARGGRFSENRLISCAVQITRRLLGTLLPWSNLFRPDIATLATVTEDNRPAARYVLFKGIVHGGFSFYTDYESNKGRELAANPYAVMVFYWHFPPRQVRIDGRVAKLSREKAEADWTVRSRENKAASAAAPQSSIVRARQELAEKVNEIKRRYKGKQIPCPETWGGFYLLPETIEFWEGRMDWIHERQRYVLNQGRWERAVLAP